MKKTRYTEEQIIGVLKQMEAGRKVSDLARELGASEATPVHLEEQVWRAGSERSTSAEGKRLVNSVASPPRR